MAYGKSSSCRHFGSAKILGEPSGNAPGYPTICSWRYRGFCSIFDHYLVLVLPSTFNASQKEAAIELPCPQLVLAGTSAYHERERKNCNPLFYKLLYVPKHQYCPSFCLFPSIITVQAFEYTLASIRKVIQAAGTKKLRNSNEIAQTFVFTVHLHSIKGELVTLVKISSEFKEMGH
ncbi:unnamed protein product [Thelazia callipaeda]|uniref:Uncharacterized protein n=1 Tax=Thelazia callipaeda TaxID=103827 RepID=A0A0N5DBH7_THECL|nr:unnamed protein product [Thelazia callipaeda]